MSDIGWLTIALSVASVALSLNAIRIARKADKLRAATGVHRRDAPHPASQKAPR